MVAAFEVLTNSQHREEYDRPPGCPKSTMGKVSLQDALSLCAALNLAWEVSECLGQHGRRHVTAARNGTTSSQTHDNCFQAWMLAPWTWMLSQTWAVKSLPLAEAWQHLARAFQDGFGAKRV